ncbi:MAG: hypothetical protein CM15mV74_480 [uncultured marine virus]|nr:MAG: hypothetical protein CM15mV74_480 [uncultured marine virus]
MIEKLLPRVLNSSSDNRLKKKTEMNDAFEIVVTEVFEFKSAETKKEGKPVKGRHQKKVPETLFTVAERRVIGVCLMSKQGWFFFLSILRGRGSTGCTQ